MSSFCAGCGTSMSDEGRFCPNCGRDCSASAPAPVDPAIALGLPPETSGKAILSLVCGLLFLLPPAAIVAVMFGHLSLSEIRKSAGRFVGRGLAITGLVLGYVGVAFLALWLVFIGIGISARLRVKRGVISQTGLGR